MILKEHQYISIGQAAKLLGLSVPTLRRYDIKHLRKLLPSENNNKTLCYARVSSHDQKKDLITQIAKLEQYCKDKHYQNIEVIQDLGSGLNFNKKGFKKLLFMILNKQCNRLILNHKDRLLRFGSEIIFKLCEFYGIEVIIIEEQDPNFEKDLVSSVLEIITVFSSKLYGKRSHKNKKTLLQTA